MPDAQSVFQIAAHPHFADNILVEGCVRRRGEFVEEARCCQVVRPIFKTHIEWSSPSATNTEKTTVAQNVTLVNKTSTSSTNEPVLEKKLLAGRYE